MQTLKMNADSRVIKEITRVAIKKKVKREIKTNNVNDY